MHDHPVRRSRAYRFVLAALLALGAAGGAQAADAALTVAASPAPVRSATNAAVLKAAQAQEQQVIATLQDLVNIESGSDDPEGLERIAAYARGALEKLGGQVETIPAANGMPPGLVKATFHGSGKLRILLIGHLDTVYHRGILETEPYRREGGKLYGPGIADDKGGVAVVLNALDVLRALGWRDYATLTVLFNADEEIGSPGSGAIIRDEGSRHDVVLSYEPSPAAAVAGSNGVLLQAAGTAVATLRVRGRAAHAGAAAGEGRNALIELSDQILKTHQAAQTVPNMQLSWTMVSGGTARNQIPAEATATGDVRIASADGVDRLMGVLTQTVAAPPTLVPDTSTEITIDVKRPMFQAGPRGTKLGELAQQIYGELGAGALDLEHRRDMPGGAFAFSGRNLILIPETTGGTDAGFAAQSGIPAVIESMGLAGWGFHAKNEYIEADSIIPRLYLTARMLMELGQQANAGTLP